MPFDFLRSAARAVLAARTRSTDPHACADGARSALPARDPAIDSAIAPQRTDSLEASHRAGADRSSTVCPPSEPAAHSPTPAPATERGNAVEAANARRRFGLDDDFEAAFAAWGSLLNVPGILLRRPALARALGPEGFGALLRDDPAALAAFAPPPEQWGELLLVAATLKTPKPSLAVAEWMSAALARAANDGGAAPARLGGDGTRALADAISQRQFRLALALLRAGVDPNGENDDGESLLAIACSRGVEELVPVLLHAGADPCRGAHSGLEAAASCGDRRTVSRMRGAMGVKGFAFDVALRAHRLAAAGGFAAVAAALVPDCEAAALAESADAAERDEKLGRLHAEGFVAFCRSMDGDLAAHQALSFLAGPDVLARGLEAALERRRWTTARAVMDAILGADSSLGCADAAGLANAVAGDFLDAMKMAAREAGLAAGRNLDAALRAEVGQGFLGIAIDCLRLTLRDPSLAATAEKAVADARNECPALAAWCEQRALLAETALEAAGAAEASPEHGRTVPRPLGALAPHSPRRL